MPVIWTPVDVSSQYPAMVDGGVRNLSPVGDVLDADPDEIVIINCGAQVPDPLAVPPGNVVQIGQRSLDLLINELFVGDMREFLNINRLVQEAAAHGVTLHSPSGRPLKYYECKVIEPISALGDTLDFSQPSIQASLAAGEERARQVLGR
jgi:NTE family protein